LNVGFGVTDFGKDYRIATQNPTSPAQARQSRKRRNFSVSLCLKVGKGFKRVSLSLEQDLLKRVTSLAKKRRISRSGLIALVLTDALAREK
jgi:hypothetical protein